MKIGNKRKATIEDVKSVVYGVKERFMNVLNRTNKNVQSLFDLQKIDDTKFMELKSELSIIYNEYNELCEGMLKTIDSVKPDVTTEEEFVDKANAFASGQKQAMDKLELLVSKIDTILTK